MNLKASFGASRHTIRTLSSLAVGSVTKPVDQFTVEDLRIMVGQKISLDYLMPLAVVELEREPLAEGVYYPGDLLANVIECGEWLRSHPRNKSAW